MATRVTNTGSGKLVANSIISFSYSEDATPIDPLSTDGGSSQITFSAIEDATSTDSVSKTNSRLMINNAITISDDDFGDIDLQVKKVDINSGGVITVTGDSIMVKLNVDKTADPFTGTLADAITYYCGLCSITPIVDAALEDVHVDFMAWKGNVWENLKLLTSSISASTTDRTPIEIYFTGTEVGFRPMPGTDFYIQETISDINQSIDSFNSAKNIDVYNYNTSYVENAIIYDIANYDENIEPSKAFLSTFSDSMSVEAGEKNTKVFTVDMSLMSVVQPVCVSTINPYPYDPTRLSTDLVDAYYQSLPDLQYGVLYITIEDANFFVDKEVVELNGDFSSFGAFFDNWSGTATKVSSNSYMFQVPNGLGSSGYLSFTAATGTRVRTGQYVIVGNDGLPVQPEEWVAQGGSLTFKKTENPNEIEVTVQGPTYDGIPLAADGSKTTFGPYKIGVETSGDGVDYPAIYLVGTGVKYNRKKVTLATGADSLVTEKEDAKTIDNMFITTNFTASNAGLAAAQASCGPNVTMTGTSAPINFAFGETINKTFIQNSARMRLSSLGFSEGTISWTAQKFTTFEDFDTINSGKTFAQFDTKTGGTRQLLFNEFSVIPLMKGI
jgi:hypothetical protein